MKVLIFSGLLVVAINASMLGEQGAKFQTFKLKHGKTYLNQAEEAKRFNIFMDNVRAIEEHNALYEQGKVSYKKGINKFTDMTQEEFEAMLAFSASKKPTLGGIPYVSTNNEYPLSVDWREDGQITEVKDQGFCMSCWAFAIAGSTEAAYKRKSGKLIDLSEQQLVDCTTDVNSGCYGGGYLDETFPYIMKYGLQADSDYPYTAEDGSCKYNESSVVTKITDYHVIQENDEDALLSAVANEGPVAVAIDSRYLSGYDSGIFEDARCSIDKLDHAVLIVGYGTKDDKDFWLVKNSWGANWGENGYFRIARGNNECGIAYDCVFPIIR